MLLELPLCVTVAPHACLLPPVCAGLQVVAEEILEVVRRVLLQGPSASEMKLRVLQPLQSSINAMRAAAKDGSRAGACGLRLAQAAAPKLVARK
jgi:hypothetical protein